MPKEDINKQSWLYQLIVTAAGVGLWLASALSLATQYALKEQATLLVLMLVAISIGLFPQHFRLPVGLGFTHERITFTLTDAIVLVIACWHGLVPAVFIAGIEGFTSSRRTTRRFSSNFFSSSMMSLGAASASVVLSAVLRYGFGEVSDASGHAFFAVTIALLVASIIQFAVNALLLATLLALRHSNPIVQHWKEFFWAFPMFLPTSSAASLMYMSLQYNPMMVAGIGGPVLLTIYFVHRQYRDSVQKRMAVMEKAHRETIEALAVAINSKDEVTHEHVLRVQIYAAGLARILGCSEAEVEALKAGALLHDIGKIAVPDYILNKPGKLTAAEFEKMKIHTIAGAQILSRVEFPYPIVPVVRHHHERWDGRGYPDGLRCEEIPLTARILSVVDCFDAVREDRPYRKGLTRKEAVDLIMRGSGTQYDPRVVGTFIAHLPEFEEEIRAHRGMLVPTFGIEPSEQLSEAARKVAPAVGFAEEAEKEQADQASLFHFEVKAICDLAQAIIGARSREEIFATFTQKLSALVPYDLCAITLVVPETGHSVVTHAAGDHAELLLGRNIEMGEGVTGWVIANRQPFCNTDPQLDLPSLAFQGSAAYRTLAIFPIIRDDHIHGAVSIYSSSLTEYTADHQMLLQKAVAFIAVALSACSQSPMPNSMRPRPIAGIVASQTLAVSDSDSLSLTCVPVKSEIAH